MKKGEKAVLTCQPDYGYGKRGSPPKIPANSTLKFEVELISWKGSGDLTEDGGIIRKTLKRGPHSGGRKPGSGDEVSVHYVATLPAQEGKVFATTREKNERLTFIVNKDAGLPPLFHKTVTHMTVGDVFRVTVQPQYAFGSKGNADLGVPPNAEVVYEIELLEAIEIEELVPGVIKKKLSEGHSHDSRSPKDGSKVEVKVTARTEGGAAFLTVTEPTKYSLGCGDLPEAAELGKQNTESPYFHLVVFIVFFFATQPSRTWSLVRWPRSWSLTPTFSTPPRRTRRRASPRAAAIPLTWSSSPTNRYPLPLSLFLLFLFCQC